MRRVREPRRETRLRPTWCAGPLAAPKAAFALPSSANAGDKVKLNGKASTDDGHIVKYYWEFGDSSTGSGVKTSHAWADPGDYEVTLWVTDDAGQQDSITKKITIQ